MANTYNYINLIAIYAIYAMSLNVLLGYAGQLSVAHAAFGAVGGYMAAYLGTSHGWHFGPGLLVGALAAGVLGVLASLPALYLDVRFLILLTLALSTAVLAVVGAIPALGGATGLTSLPFPTIFGQSLLEPSHFVIFSVIVALIVLAICSRLVNSPFGRVLRALREDEVAARGVGKNIVRYKVTVFGVTAAMAGVAGVMLSYYNASIQPGGFDLSQSMQIIAMIVIGGTANLYGSILGATIIVLLDPFLQNVVNLDPDTAGLVRTFIYGSLIVIFMMVLPQGLIRERWTIGRLLGRRSAKTAGGIDVAKLADVTEDSNAQEAAAEAAAAGAGQPAATGQLALEAKGLRKYFGGIRAADELSLQLRTGQVTGLIGPNGAGKTTVFNLLTRVIPPDAGTVSLGDTEITEWTPNRIAVSGMSRSYQDVRIWSRMTVLENVMLAIPHQPGERLFNVFFRPLAIRKFERQAATRAMEHLQFVGLAEHADEEAGSLPFGDQKLLALARLLATEADVLLLDEPASGIDIDGVERMLGLIERLRARGKCVCIVEHNLHVVERLADRVYFMEAGRITAEGTMSELMQQERLSEVYFGSS
ncbi:branched-chain amino acid ABC transporter ATP-binding protein/permease [Baekduia soli]|uniref:Branched-chain amino acid ABC transporter ATP-binding protein/permease n=1 Tax=Baekduia soli TaxID=496014 RepID=A0A5B8U841_9ACTN|nr:branched-chain amino acid ABC transporter ATP-binding protein/permease [Baekduia soli]QEC49276.1 branched-chain amino acid ABC transporter ATP-binding protein/permease [Baekduia soli]